MAWTPVSKPSSSSYTNVAKPSSSNYTNVAKPNTAVTIRAGMLLLMMPCAPLTVSNPISTTGNWIKVNKPT